MHKQLKVRDECNRIQDDARLVNSTAGSVPEDLQS